MCLFPRIVKNPKYLPNKKNKGNPPICTDERLLYVPIKCGQCIECRKQKAREWRVRLEQEYTKSNEKAYFVTLTFNQKSWEKYIQKAESENQGVTLAVRRFLERWRKETKRSVRHWLITEKGEDYDRIHLHGIIWTNESTEFIKKKWSYGFSFIGSYVNNKTINYITKYITKRDEKHKDFEGKILCSAGIGRGYNTKQDYHKFNGINTNDHIRLANGTKIQLPIYYRNKIYTEEEREKLWLIKTEENIRYIRGIKFDMKREDERERFFKVLTQEQQENKRLGYGGLKKEWNPGKYGKELEKLAYSKKNVY